LNLTDIGKQHQMLRWSDQSYCKDRMTIEFCGSLLPKTDRHKLLSRPLMILRTGS